MAVVLALALGLAVGWVVFAPASPNAATSAETSSDLAEASSEAEFTNDAEIPREVPPEVTSEVESLLDAFFTAWTDGDVDAVLGMMMPTGTFDFPKCLDARADDPVNGAARCVQLNPYVSFLPSETEAIIVDASPQKDGSAYEVSSVVVKVLTKEGEGADPASPNFTGEDELTHFKLARDDSGQLKISLYELFQ